MSTGHYCEICGDVCYCDGSHQCEEDLAPAYEEDEAPADEDDFTGGMPYCDVCQWFHDPYDGHVRREGA